MDNSETYRHESYGVILISRWQGGSQPLFGSSILHQNGIRFEIKTAVLERDLNRDWVHSDKIICEFNMSPSQFVDAITGLNHGDGTPITLSYVTGDQKPYREKPPYENKVQTFNKEFDQKCKDIANRFDNTLKLAEETHAQKRLVNEIQMLRQEIASNLPFINKSFTEQMEHTVTEAKGEVDAFVTGMIHNYGIEAIRNQSPQLPEATVDGQFKELTQGDSEVKNET